MKLVMDKPKNSGLTLIELLVVIVILGILATIGFGQYRTSQIKARDAQRKGDLDNIARALEMYYNDHEAYPVETDNNGLMEVDTGDGSVDDLAWGQTLESADAVYMKTLPEDPVSDYDYCYDSDDDGTYYKLYARIENANDEDYYESGYTCGGDTYYYGIASSNESLP